MSRETSPNIFFNSLPSPNTIKNLFTLKSSTYDFINHARTQVSAIMHGQNDRQLLILGPCSIHNIEEALAYAEKIKGLQEKVKDHFFILMRVYFAKSRTSIGWKGLLLDPDLCGINDVSKGITLTRKLLSLLAEQEVPVATEFLDPLSVNYTADLISWGCIGARTSESQTHREMASGLPMPIGFKNNTNGNIDVAVKGAFTATNPHVLLGIDEHGHVCQINTKGNPNCHIVLRGGESGTNYDPASISEALKLLKDNHFLEKIMIDCSHGNSQSNHNNQILVFESVINQIIEGNHNIFGLILESYLHEGKQQLPTTPSGPIKQGVSVTDPCINWETTERLILLGYEKLQKNALLNLNVC